MKGTTKTYDFAFFTGVAFNCVLFLILNGRSIEDTTSNGPKAIQISGIHDPVWGFPFRMVNGDFVNWGYAALGNVAVFVVSGFALGIIFHIVLAEIARSFSSARRR